MKHVTFLFKPPGTLGDAKSPVNCLEKSCIISLFGGAGRGQASEGWDGAHRDPKEKKCKMTSHDSRNSISIHRTGTPGGGTDPTSILMKGKNEPDH
jgi:hypothetical protein